MKRRGSIPTFVPDEEVSVQTHDLSPYPRQPEERIAVLEDPAEIDLLAHTAVAIRVLWSERRLILKWVVASFLVSLALVFLLPIRYESTTRLMPPQENGGAGALVAALSAKGGDALAGLGSSLLEVKTSGALFIAVIHGNAVENALIDQFDLMHLYRTRSRERARKILDGRISTTEDRKSGVLTVSISDRDPYRAAQMTAACVERLNRVLTSVNNSSAHRERVFLEDRLKSAETQLYTSEKTLSEFSSKNGAVDIKEQGRALLQAGADLEGELIALRSQLKGLEEIYSDSNVRVRTVKARIAALESQLQALSGSQTDGHHHAAVGSEESSGLLPSLRQLPSLGVTYADLYREVKVQEAVFETLTKEYELARVQEAKEAMTVRVFDQAEVPERRSFPPRLLIIAVCTVLGLILGASVVVFRRYWAEIPSDHPARILGREISRSLRTRATENGTGSLGGLRLESDLKDKVSGR